MPLGIHLRRRSTAADQRPPPLRRWSEEDWDALRAGLEFCAVRGGERDKAVIQSDLDALGSFEAAREDPRRGQMRFARAESNLEHFLPLTRATIKKNLEDLSADFTSRASSFGGEDDALRRYDLQRVAKRLRALAAATEPEAWALPISWQHQVVLLVTAQEACEGRKGDISEEASGQ